MHNSSPLLVCLGFDFGMKRIGVATGQSLTHSATPLCILRAQDGQPEWKIIEELIHTWQINTLVVGIPYHMDGTEQELTFAAKKFAHRLQNNFKLPVHCVDERLTSIEAKRREGNTKNANHIDSIAAQIILEDFLKNHFLP